MPHTATWIDLDQIKQRLVSVAQVPLSTLRFSSVLAIVLRVLIPIYLGSRDRGGRPA
jgi:hypothetical protein